MLNCDCMSIKYNLRETQSPYCKGQYPTWSAALQAIQPPPSPDGPTQTLPQGALRAVKCMGSAQTSCFPWQLSSFPLLWEEERWVPLVFSGHISVRWWPASALLHALLHHGALIFLILHISWKHTDVRDSKKHTIGLVHSYPWASTKSKRYLFPERMESFDSGAQRPALGLHCTVMRREREREREREQEKGREEGREGGRALFIKLDLFCERDVLHSESMFSLSFLEVMLDIFIEMMLVVR